MHTSLLLTLKHHKCGPLVSESPNSIDISTSLTSIHLKINSSLWIYYVLIFSGRIHCWPCFVKRRSDKPEVRKPVSQSLHTFCIGYPEVMDLVHFKPCHPDSWKCALPICFKCVSHIEHVLVSPFLWFTLCFCNKVFWPRHLGKKRVYFSLYFWIIVCHWGNSEKKLEEGTWK